MKLQKLTLTNIIKQTSSGQVNEENVQKFRWSRSYFVLIIIEIIWWLGLPLIYHTREKFQLALHIKFSGWEGCLGKTNMFWFVCFSMLWQLIFHGPFPVHKWIRSSQVADKLIIIMTNYAYKSKFCFLYDWYKIIFKYTNTCFDSMT